MKEDDRSLKGRDRFLAVSRAYDSPSQSGARERRRAKNATRRAKNAPRDGYESNLQSQDFHRVLRVLIDVTRLGRGRPDIHSGTRGHPAGQDAEGGHQRQEAEQECLRRRDRQEESHDQVRARAGTASRRHDSRVRRHPTNHKKRSAPALRGSHALQSLTVPSPPPRLPPPSRRPVSSTTR